MYRTKELVVEKDQVSVSAKVEGEIFSGTISVGNQERVLDLFNSSKLFFAIDVDGETIIINKSSISWIKPNDQARMAMGPNKKPKKNDLYLGFSLENTASTQDNMSKQAVEIIGLPLR